MIKGRCSICRVSMKQVNGVANPVSRSVTNRNSHHHKKVWKFIPNEFAEGYRYWHDHAPEMVTHGL